MEEEKNGVPPVLNIIVQYFIYSTEDIALNFNFSSKIKNTKFLTVSLLIVVPKQEITIKSTLLQNTFIVLVIYTYDRPIG